jgi:hypothetical protein
MPILNYTTTISADKTAAELGRILAKGGAASVSTAYEDGRPVGVGFSLQTPHGARHFQLPVNVAGVHAALRADKSVPERYRLLAQAERVAWRIVKDWIEAQVALVQAQMATLDEVMLPYLLEVGSGRTLYQVYVANEHAALEAGGR